jgi:hypothetical protein
MSGSENFSKLKSYRHSFNETFSSASASTTGLSASVSVSRDDSKSQDADQKIRTLTHQNSQRLSLDPQEIDLDFIIPVANLESWLDEIIKKIATESGSEGEEEGEEEEEKASDIIQDTFLELKDHTDRYESLDYSMKKYDLCRLILLKGFGYAPDGALKYIFLSIFSSKLKPFFYHALSLYEETITEFDELQSATIFEDLCSKSIFAMKWLTTTRAQFPQPLVDSFISYLKSMIFQSVMAANWIRLATAALLHLMRRSLPLSGSHQQQIILPSFSDVIHRFEVIFSKSVGHGANLISIAILIAQQNQSHADLLALEISKYFKKVWNCLSLCLT